MKILYVTNLRLPTEKAHGAQIMKMCEAFAQSGAEVELAIPDRRSSIVEDPFEYYGIRTKFTITRLPIIDTIGWGPLGFLFESFIFGLRARKYLRKRGPDVLYGRDELVLCLMPRHSLIVWETHTGAWNFCARRISVTARLLVAISQGLKDFYVAHGVSAEKIIVEHDGTDLKTFADLESKEAARRRLSLPKEKKIVMYAGRLDGWKGSETLFSAAAMLPQDVVVAVIGGEQEQVEVLRKCYPNVAFLGYRPYRELADNLVAADLLVLPNTGRDEISVHFTSPLKLFSYMASGVPVVVSDLPSIREVVDEKSAFFFSPDDSVSLATTIKKALSDESAADKARAALQKVEAYTWTRRAENILAALKL
jgi:glycosyltransferase involved in cell wall biosynthesis